MRRGQIFTLDALLSLVLVMIVLGVVINTNESVMAEINSIMGWYERANLGDNMLDVLTKSAGEPENWESNLSGLKSVGLRSINYTYAVDYGKLIAMVRNVNLSSVKQSLLNFSSWKDFQLDIYLTNISVNLAVSTSPLQVQVVNISYTYASNLSEPTFRIAFINGSLVTDEGVINSSKAGARWISYHYKDVIVARRVYYSTVNVSRGQEVLAGVLKENVPPYAELEITVPADESGYVIFSVLDGDVGKALVVQKESSTSDVVASIIEGSTTLYSYTGNSTAVSVPWVSLFEEFNTQTTVKIVGMRVYDDTFAGTVTMRDLNGLGVLLAPRLEPGVLKLWMWES
ncbi:hypothetical protein [Thermococcus sp.]